jgi:hypothetical protein
MPTSKSRINDTISAKQMKEAIQRSGYLLEQRIEPIIAGSGYYVETNPIFKDAETGKSREIDVRALTAVSVYKKAGDFIFPMLLCECENNSHPLVFFARKSMLSFNYCDDIAVSGIPAKFWDNDGYVSLPYFTRMEKFHHYCKGDIATQYCSFQLKKDKSSWIAVHNEEQHDTLNALVKAIDYEVDDHFRGWYLPDQIDEEHINIQIYYPLLILQGDLYSAHLKNTRLVLKKARHVQCRKQYFSSFKNEVQTYQIDVIVEDYLSRYLEIIEAETEKIKQVLQRNKVKVFESIERIVKEAKEGRKERDSYRKYLEF